MLAVFVVVFVVFAVAAVFVVAKSREGVAEQECPGEPTGLDIGGVTDIVGSASKNAAAFADVLSALESRLLILETAVKDNTVSINNVTYSDLIVDITDPTTFDVTLPQTLPVISLVGNRPQKIKFLLPRGLDGPDGSTGLNGPDAVEMPPVTRGPPGAESNYGALPEQWLAKNFPQ
jgi:hypothetical protein